jgi:hypothetical protein
MSIGRLLLYKLKIFGANFTRGDTKKRVVRGATAAAIIAAFAVFCFGAYGVFAAIKMVGDDGFLLAGVMVTLTLHGLLLLAFVFDIATTTNIFFLSSDLNLLMVAPLPALKIFVVKFFEALGSGSLITSFVAFPILLGFGLAFGAPWTFYVVMFVIIALFLSIPVSIGTIAGLVISRFAPASRVKEVLGVVGGILALAFWVTIQLLRPAIRDNVHTGDVTAQMKSLAAYGGNALVKVLPSSLAANALARFAAGQSGQALPSVLVLSAMAGLMFVVSVVAAKRIYLAGWVRVGPAGRKRRAQRPSPLLKLLAWLPPFERSVVTTSTSLFLRDPQQIMPVATITIMMALFPFLIGRRAGGIVSPTVVLQSFAALSFVGSMNLAVNTTLIDGRTFWLMLCAPRSSMRKLFSKLLVSALFFVPLAAGAAVAFRAAGVIGWAAVPRVLLFSACTTFLGGGIGVMLAMKYGDWQWEIPKRMLKTSGRFVMLGIMGAFFAVITIVVAAHSAGHSVKALAHIPNSLLLLATAAGGLLTYVLLRIASIRMDKMEWKV